jgi:acyl carrier protein
MQTRDDIFNTLRDALVELFELEPARVTLDANLYQDLEIDSIDAVDLIDHIKRQTGKKIAAEEFKSVRTVNDVVEAVYRLVQRGTHESADWPWPVAGRAAVPLCGVLRHEHFAPWQFGLLLGSLWLAARADRPATPWQCWMAVAAMVFCLLLAWFDNPHAAALVPEPGQRVHAGAVRPEPEIRPTDVERLARLREPQLPDRPLRTHARSPRSGACFFLCNGLLAAGLTCGHR